jgi:hypothetical protein
MSHAQSSTSLTSVEWSLDVVLEDTRGSVVGETFAQLNNGNKEGGFGKGLSDVTECLLLFLGWSLLVVAIVLFSIDQTQSLLRRSGSACMACVDLFRLEVL